MYPRPSSISKITYPLPNLPVPDLSFQPDPQRTSSTSCSRFLPSCPRGGATSSSCCPTPWYPDPACPRPSVRQPHIGTMISVLPCFPIFLPPTDPPAYSVPVPPPDCLPNSTPTPLLPPRHGSCLTSRQDKSSSSLCSVEPHLGSNHTRDKMGGCTAC